MDVFRVSFHLKMIKCGHRGTDFWHEAPRKINNTSKYSLFVILFHTKFPYQLKTIGNRRRYQD